VTAAIALVAAPHDRPHLNPERRSVMFKQEWFWELVAQVLGELAGGLVSGGGN